MSTKVRNALMFPGLIVAGTLLLLSAPLAFGAAAEPLASPGDASALAWIRFDGGQEYAGTPYLWLGDSEIRLEIDVPCQPGCALDLLWGSKKDSRGAALTINGKSVTANGGGYDGFKWLRVTIPKDVAGKQHQVVFRAVAPKPAFLAEVRLVGPGAITSPADTKKKPAHGISLKTTATAGAAALRKAPAAPVFPEMRKMWDTPLAPPAKQATDPTVEAAFRQAEKHGRQANEMYFRSRKLVDGWLAYADPNTGLLPRRINRPGGDRTIWNAQDCAADLYPFLVLTCALTDREMFNGRMREILRTETKLTCRIDRLPDTYSFTKKGFATDKADLNSIMFGSSEYVKDGLMPLTEWLGDSPWRDRMIGIVDDMWKHAPVETPFGKIVSTNFEVNGEMLQVLSRVYWMTGEKKYLQWAIRLGDYYLLGDHHPTRTMQRLSMDDHGCEMISGLCELYATVHFAMPAKKEAYRQPLHEMLDTILAKARTEHGVFWDSIDLKTGKHATSLTDNWGYDLNGFYTVYMVDKTPGYRQAVVKALSNITEHYIDYKWEGGGADGYADSIEGAINLYNRERIASAMPFIDSGIRNMWRRQRPDGVIEGWYGDGNSARTAIMYALMKALGITVQPWRSDVRLGAAETGGKLCVSVYSDKPWSGRLVFDRPRHKVQMRLPIDYPRINQFPEWFTVQADGRYAIGDLAAGTKATLTGKQLAAGMEIKLPGRAETRLVVAPTGE